MGYMSMRELNANVSRAMASVEEGDDLILTRNGKPVLRVTRHGVAGDARARRSKAIERLRQIMESGISGIHGPATVDERTER